MCVYYFMRRGSPSGVESLSKRRATLETIRGMGEPVMESRLVVDHTEVDANGFLTGRASEDSHPVHNLWAQARSLESRASSRDFEAQKLEGLADGEHRNRLREESRELRDQAEALRKRLSAIKADTVGG
jgi:CHAD domain-containing protein